MAKQAHLVPSGWEELLKGYERDQMPEERLKARLQGEGEARNLLEKLLGQFNEQDIRDFLAALNTDFWNGKERHSRFMPAFYGSLANQIAASREAFNRWTEKLWHVNDEALDALLDDFWQKNEVAGSGTSLPTAILYLRDPDAYAIWMPGLERGLKNILPSLKLAKRRTAVGYRIYNETWQNIREQTGFVPQMMDLALILASVEPGTATSDFEDLFKDMVGEYIDSQEGQAHLRGYASQRQEAQENFKRLKEMESRGEDITDSVLLKLLPYTNTEHNRTTGRWIHLAPCISKDIKHKFQNAGWTKPDDWPKISRTILDFTKRCVEEPESLIEHCRWFADAIPSKGFQAGMLSPILNALKPESFNIINSKPRKTLNYLLNKNYDSSLEDYSDLNRLHFDFQKKHKELLDEVSQEGTLPGDIFDLFCHWLVAIRKFSFKEAKVYKIAPGADVEYWDTCRDEGYICMGWDEFGDLSGFTREQFDERRDALLAEHKDWKKGGVGQVWRFSRIQEGDIIIANNGKTRILGFGTVIGPYYYVPNEKMNHRLPVMWDDITPRKVNEASWGITLQKVSPDRFEMLRVAPLDVEEPPGDRPISPPDTVDVNPEYSIEQCSIETGLKTEIIERWLSALDRRRQAVFYGPPGTGKTFIADKLARHLISGTDGFTQLVQFHPEYAYQDFIQGIRPVTGKDGMLRYENVPGVFKQFCSKAEECHGNCVLIIDEINRANLSRVFGELMYLLEYRNTSVELSGGGRFRIPENVFIIGTMNTADRSIALVDYALRRRFAFIRLAPDYDVLKKAHEDASFDVTGLIGVMKELNAQIGDPHYEVGISFFLVDNLETDIEDIWHMEIEPYLEEYFFDNLSKAEQFSWEKVRDRIQS